MDAAPVAARLDAAAIQIKNLLFVFAGYGTVDYLHLLKRWLYHKLVHEREGFLFYGACRELDKDIKI
ncbi:hypothetical protein Pyn_26162 [Prunus yedoensis var. nudiflora]|uniref:Uncharacterized protein n=1 Tax=Prunus yedoensis var. nudiflora TaxID=2094558 RepID=A0A314YB04_PRUYE|nr:hypothetical protein Pyn_26162 [Prunus yedoensis var. nudiflora]